MQGHLTKLSNPIPVSAVISQFHLNKVNSPHFTGGGGGFDNNNKIMYSHHNLVVILSCGYVSATRQVEGRSPNRKSIHMDMERMFQHEQCSCPMRNKIKEVMGNRWARGDARQCFSKVKSCESSHMYTQGF